MSIPARSIALAILALGSVVGQCTAQQKASPPLAPWLDGALETSLARAQALQRPLLLYFWMDGSQHCSDLWGQTLNTPQATQVLANFVCHSAKATTATGGELIRRYGITTLPTLLVVLADGAVEDAMLGFVPPANFAAEIQRILQNDGTVSSLRDAAAASPDDLDLRLALGVKLHFVGDTKAGEAIYESIRAEDPQGQTAAGAELLLAAIRQSIIDAAPNRADAQTWDLEPMYRRLRASKEDIVSFKGYDWLARVEGQRGDRKRQRQAWQNAWACVSDNRASEWSADVLAELWRQRDELQRSDRRLARSMAEHLAAQTRLEAFAASNVKLQALAWRSIACGKSMAGQRSKALVALAKARALLPNDSDLELLQAQIGK